MRATRHVNSSFGHWLKSLDLVRTRGADILSIGRTETLTDDFAEFVQLL